MTSKEYLQRINQLNNQINQMQLAARYARRHLTGWQTDQAQNCAASYIDEIVPFDPAWEFGDELVLNGEFEEATE